MAPPKPVSPELARPNSDEDLAFASIRQLGSLLRGRKVSSVELTKLYLARLRRYDPLLKCVVTFMDEVALQQAKQADRELAEGKDRGALHGIPWGLKDIIAYPGYPTTWCAPQYRHRVINVKAAVAERLEDAGAVLIAKLATNPFAGGGVEWYRGLTRCPWNPHLDAAGSSSGSASATAAGLVGFSIATDTGRQHYRSVHALRHGRAASNLRPSEPVRRHATVLVARYHRADLPQCRRLRVGLRRDPWRRSARHCVRRSPLRVALLARHLHDQRGVLPGKTAKTEARENCESCATSASSSCPFKRRSCWTNYGLTYDLAEAVVAMESAASFEELTRRGEPKGVHGWPRYWA